MHIAFLASNKHPRGYRSDPAFTYRCENLAHALRSTGYDISLDHRRTWHGRDAGVIVVHRPRVSFGLWQQVRRWRRAGSRLVADFDDLVFDEALARFSPAVRNGQDRLWRLRRRFREHHAAARWFDHITVSTDPLLDHARRCFPGKPVTRLYNAVHWDWRRAGPPKCGHGGGRLISYMPGTRSHDRDFAMIAEPLSRFLRKYPEIRLRVTGLLDFQLDVPERQIVHRDKVPFSRFADEFADVWVNLAPLERTPFNESKSALKALEAGYWGIPTICSPNPDFARFADAGALVASEPAAWFEALESLLDEENYRSRVEQLRSRTLALADVEQQAQIFLEQVVRRVN